MFGIYLLFSVSRINHRVKRGGIIPFATIKYINGGDKAYLLSICLFAYSLVPKFQITSADAKGKGTLEKYSTNAPLLISLDCLINFFFVCIGCEIVTYG